MFRKKQPESAHGGTVAEASTGRRRLDICQTCHHHGGEYVNGNWVKCDDCTGTGQVWVTVSS